MDGFELATIREAGDLDSHDAVVKFNELLVAKPDVRWTLARVDRYEGLTIFNERRTEGIHFRNAVCGFSGPEPTASIEILATGRFGDKAGLKRSIERHNVLTFRR